MIVTWDFTGEYGVPEGFPIFAGAFNNFTSYWYSYVGSIIVTFCIKG